MAANYTLTGNFQQLTGVTDATGQLIIQLCNYGNQTPRATGVIITTGPQTVTCVAGAFIVTLWGNDQITPSGTFYTVRILTSKGQLVSDTSYQFVGGGSNDLSALTPIASTPPSPVSAYALLDSPTFINVPKAPTAGLGTNTTQLATTAFVIANTGASSSVAIPTAGGTSPTPIYTADIENNTGVNPAIYVQDGAGNWHPQAGIDTTTVDSAGSGPTVPAGILTHNRIQYFRDTQSPTQGGKNAFLSVNHLAGAGTSYNNQDRALWISMTNIVGNIVNFAVTANVVTLTLNNLTTGVAGIGTVGFRKGQRIQSSGLSTGTYLNAVPLTILTASAITGSNTSALQTITASDAGFTHANVGTTADAGKLNQLLYAMENIQLEQDVMGSPVFVSAVDGEASTLSVQMSDKHVGNSLSAPNFGCNAIRAEYFREAGAGTWGSVNPSVMRVVVQDNATTGDAFEQVNGLTITGNCASSCPDEFLGIQLIPPPVRFTVANYGIYVNNWGANAGDYAIYVQGGQCFFGGPVAFGAPATPAQYTVAALPAGAEGQIAYATNGRKVGEGAGSGTGVPVYFSNTHWRVYSTDATVTS